MKKNNTLLLTRTAMLAALAVILSFLESMIPPLLPLPPGAKAGFSNIATMYACENLGLFSALGISIVKGIFALLTRGMTAGIMSISGGILSALIMYLLIRYTKKTGFAGIGISGALSHNFAQLIMAYILVGETAFFYIPWLILISIVSGTLTGIILKLVSNALMRIKNQ